MKYIAVKYLLKMGPFGPPVQREQVVPENHLNSTLANLKSKVIGATDIRVSTPFEFPE